jgi:hypothetical protein
MVRALLAQKGGRSRNRGLAPRLSDGKDLLLDLEIFSRTVDPKQILKYEK